MGSSGSWWGPVVCSCEHSNKTFGFDKRRRISANTALPPVIMLIHTPDAYEMKNVRISVQNIHLFSKYVNEI
jgi:hypothetical protein